VRRVGRLLLAGAGAAVALASASAAVWPAAASAADDAVRVEASRRIADEADARVTLRVTRPATVALREARVAYTTEDDEALAGADYVASRGTIVLGVGQTTATIDVLLLDDRAKEATERFHVVLTDPDRPGATLDRTWIDLTDDDEWPAPQLGASDGGGGAGAVVGGAAGSSVTAPARPARRPAASSGTPGRSSAGAAARKAGRTTPFKLYRPAPSRPVATEPPSTSSPVASLGIVAAVLLACISARLWHHRRTHGAPANP
jgi:hypothetical protein